MKYVKDAFAIESLGSAAPSEEDLSFFNDYIEGKKDINLLNEAITKYKV